MPGRSAAGNERDPDRNCRRGFAMCALLVESKLPRKGFVRQEEANLFDFLSNRFGRYYA